jgi:hypothetical protein
MVCLTVAATIRDEGEEPDDASDVPFEALQSDSDTDFTCER